MATEYDIILSNGTLFTTIYPLEFNGPNNNSIPRVIAISLPTYGINQIGGTSNFIISGDRTTSLIAGLSITVVGSPSNDGTYVLSGPSTYHMGLNETTVPIVGGGLNPTAGGNITINAFVVGGDLTNRFIPSFTFNVLNSGANDGIYSVSAFGSYVSGDFTFIPVSTTIPSNSLPHGVIQYTNTDVSTTLLLPGKGMVNYGLHYAESLVRMVETFAADTSPDNSIGGTPLVGQQWYRTLVGQEAFLYWDGSQWSNDYAFNDVDLTGFLTLSADPTNPLHAATKQYVDSVGGGGSSTVDGLTDTNITSVTAGELLKWDGAEWINNTLSEAGIAASTHNHNADYVSKTGDTMTGNLTISTSLPVLLMQDNNSTGSSHGGYISWRDNVNSEKAYIGFLGNQNFDINQIYNSPIRLFTNNTQRLYIENDGTISAQTPSYETLVTADNDIPNKKYVDDKLPLYAQYIGVTTAGPYATPGAGGNNTHLGTAKLQVFVDGALQIEGIDYTFSASAITLTSPPGSFNLVIYEF